MDLSWPVDVSFLVLDENNTIMCRTDVAWM
jgi:hypothetical protein